LIFFELGREKPKKHKILLTSQAIELEKKYCLVGEAKMGILVN